MQSSTDDIFNASQMRSSVENQCVSEGKEPTELKLLPVTAGLQEPAEPSRASPQLCVVTEDHLLSQHGLKGLLPATARPQDHGTTGSSHVIQSCLHRGDANTKEQAQAQLWLWNRSLPVLLITKFMPISQERSEREPRPRAV